MKRDRSQKYHNRVAKQYDAIYNDDAYWIAHDEITWATIKPHLPTKRPARGLDLGCGTGKWGLKLLKSGVDVTFVDHSPAMVGEVREKLAAMGARGARGEGIAADIIAMPMLADTSFDLTVAMGDPLSICTDPPAAIAEMFRTLAPGGVVIATADNRLSGYEHYLERGDLDALETFARNGRTKWVTDRVEEQFELTTFTPSQLRRAFEAAGFEVVSVIGKTILPLRKYRAMLSDPETRRRLIELELRLNRDESAAAVAGHLQITARRPVHEAK